jgi:hypothetical protein
MNVAIWSRKYKGHETQIADDGDGNPNIGIHIDEYTIYYASREKEHTEGEDRYQFVRETLEPDIGRLALKRS